MATARQVTPDEDQGSGEMPMVLLVSFSFWERLVAAAAKDGVKPGDLLDALLTDHIGNSLPKLGGF